MKTHPHETKVFAIFNQPEQAQQGLHALESLHLPPEDISLVNSEEAFQKEEWVKLIGGVKLHEEAVHAGKIGTLAGAVVGALTIITGMITGGASILAAGPMVVTVIGAGGLLGGLIGAGFTDNEAESIDNAIRNGKILIVVHAANKDIAKQAEQILKQQGAEKIHHHN